MFGYEHGDPTATPYPSTSYCLVRKRALLVKRDYGLTPKKGPTALVLLLEQEQVSTDTAPETAPGTSYSPTLRRRA